MTIISHQFITLTVDICVQHGGVRHCIVWVCQRQWRLVTVICVLIVFFIAFTENEAGEISLQLEQYLKTIATTGQTLYVILNLFKMWLVLHRNLPRACLSLPPCRCHHVVSPLCLRLCMLSVACGVARVFIILVVLYTFIYNIIQRIYTQSLRTCVITSIAHTHLPIFSAASARVVLWPINAQGC